MYRRCPRVAGGFRPPLFAPCAALAPRPFSRHCGPVRGASGRCGSPRRSPARPPPRPLRGSLSGRRRRLLPCASVLRTRRRAGVVRVAKGGPSAPPGRYAPTVLVGGCSLRRPPSSVGPVRGAAAFRGVPPLSPSATAARQLARRLRLRAHGPTGRLVGRGAGRGQKAASVASRPPLGARVGAAVLKSRCFPRRVSPQSPPALFPPKGKEGARGLRPPLRRGRGLPLKLPPLSAAALQRAKKARLPQ